MFNEKYPDIQVDVLTMGAQEILERVRAEKSNPRQIFGGVEHSQPLCKLLMKIY